MRLSHPMIALILFATALAPFAGIAGCAGEAIVYDPFWHDYHRWSPGENRRYRQWEMGSNRAHLDFPDRTPGDQLAYWNWRHS
jgi:hypothetical protein